MKVHVRAEGQGKTIALVLAPGQRHEATAFEALMTSGAVKRLGPGRPKIRPKRIVGDKGYFGDALRKTVSEPSCHVADRRNSDVA